MTAPEQSLTPINQHKDQAELTRQLNERIKYLTELTDGAILGLFRSAITEFAIARFKNDLPRLETIHRDLVLIEEQVYRRMAERRTKRYGFDAD